MNITIVSDTVGVFNHYITRYTLRLMSDIKPNICMLYGEWQHSRGPSQNEPGLHPWHEDMFMRPDRLMSELAQEGFNWTVAHVLSEPTGIDELPLQMRIADNPVYLDNGHLSRDTVFRDGEPEDLLNVAGCIDHWVRNFQDEVTQPDGTIVRTAYGVGLDALRLWNHKSIQSFGNNKSALEAAMAKVMLPIDLIRSYNALEYENLAADNNGDCSVIYKPLGGSRGKGVVTFKSIDAYRRALDEDSLPVNGIIQRYRNNSAPIYGLRGATEADNDLLSQFVMDERYPKEVRWHITVNQDGNGQQIINVAPTLKIGHANEPIMRVRYYVGLDPDCSPVNTPMYETAFSIGARVVEAASTPNEPVTQFYGNADFIVEGHIHDEAASGVNDVNVRGPHLPVQAYEARKFFIKALVSSGHAAMKR